MRISKTIIGAALVLAMAFGAGAQAAAASRAKPASSVSAYDAASPESLTPDHLYAQSAILINAATGAVIFQKDAERIMYPASTTKLMTALLVVESLDMGEVVTCSVNATNTEATWIPVKKYEQYTTEQLMHALLMKSANDAAIALAEQVSGTVKDFAALMNQRALELGCANTNFKNANGLPNSDHYTTVSDMAKIARAAYENQTIRDIIKTTEYVIPSTNLRDDPIKIENSNKFLANSGDADFSYPYGTGMKTGYTNDAQSCFVGAAEKDGLTLISVVFGSTTEGKWTDTIKLMDYGFAVMNYIDVAELYARKPYQLMVRGGMDTDTKDGMLELVIAPGQETLLSRYYDSDDVLNAIQAAPSLYLTVTAPNDSVAAPIEADQQLATLSFFTEGMSRPVTVDLVAKNAVATKPIPPTAPVLTIAPEVADGGSFFPEASDDTKKKLLGYLMFIPAAVIAVLAFLLLCASVRQARAQRLREAAQAAPLRRPPSNGITRYRKR